MVNLFTRLARYFPRSIRSIINKVRYPSIRIAHNANLDIRGVFMYQSDCSIGEGANLVIPQKATLILGDACYVGRYVELGPCSRIEIGSQTSIQDRSILIGDVFIGRYCLISLNVLISSGRHYYDLKPWCLIKDQDCLAAQNPELTEVHSRRVVIEDDCWLGVNVVVMPGINIGKGAVIGANSVVTKDVDPYTVVAGTPAKIIKKRLDFMPPRKLIYTNPHDWPYFYAGFELSMAILKTHTAHDGVFTQKEFVLCLDRSVGNSICLELMSIGLMGSVLNFEDQRKEVSNKMQKITFDICGTSSKKFRFQVEGESGNSVIIKSAWIQ